MDLDLTSGPGGLSVPPIKKKRRSSILKMPTQIPSNSGRWAPTVNGGNERPVLQDLNPNSPQGLLPNVDTPTPTTATTTATFHRRQSSKRVSFSSCKMVKEFETGSHTLTVWNNTYEEDHSHATSTSQAEEDAQSGVQPHKKPRPDPRVSTREVDPNGSSQAEDVSVDLDRSVFPSPPSHARLDMTVNATSAMEITRTMTPSPGAGGPSIASQTMEMTLAPGDESSLSALSSSRYTNGFLQGLDMTIGEPNWPEEDDLTQGVEMTKSLSRAYQLKLEDRPPPVRTDVSSALHYLQELNAAPSSNASPCRGFRRSKTTPAMDRTQPLAQDSADGALTTHAKSFEALMSEELAKDVGLTSSGPIQQGYADEGQERMTKSVNTGRQSQLASNNDINGSMELTKEVHPVLQSKLASSLDPNESMELTKAVHPELKSKLASSLDPNESMELTKAVNPELKSKLASSIDPNESMELTKAVNPGLQSKSPIFDDPNESMELTKAVNPGLQSKLASSIDPNESMELTKAVNPGLQSKSPIFDDPNESMELTKAVNPGLQSKLASSIDPNESMELTKAVNPGLQSKSPIFDDPNESMELTKAVNPGLQSKLASSIDPNESMELTKAVHPGLQSKLTSHIDRNESMEFTKAVNPGLQSKLAGHIDRNESMELTKAVNPGLQSKLAGLIDRNESMEFTKAVNPGLQSKLAGHIDRNESMELTKAVNPGLQSKSPIFDDPNESMDLTKAVNPGLQLKSATFTNPNESMELTKAVNPGLQSKLAGHIDRNESMELTKAVNLDHISQSSFCINSTEGSNQEDIVEPSDAIGAPISTTTNNVLDRNEDLKLHPTIKAPPPVIIATVSRDLNDSNEPTTASSAPVTINIRDSKCTELANDVKIRSLLTSTDQIEITEKNKAVDIMNPTDNLLGGSESIDHIKIGSSKEVDKSMELTWTFGSKSSCEPPTETLYQTKNGTEFTKALGSLHNHGDTLNDVETPSNKSNSFQNVDISYGSNNKLNAPDTPVLTTICMDRNEKIEITMEITENIKRYTDNTMDEENHVRRFTMGTETSDHSEQRQAIDEEILSSGRKSRSIAEGIQDSLDETHREENAAPKIPPTSQNVTTALEKMLVQESGLLQEDSVRLQNGISFSWRSTHSKDEELDPTDKQASKPSDVPGGDRESLQNYSPIAECSMSSQNTSVRQDTLVPEPPVKKTTPLVKPKREKISIFAWLARVQSNNASRNTPLDHGRWELVNMTDWRSTLSFLHNTLVLNISLGYSLPVDDSWDSSVSIKHWTISSIEFQTPTLTQMCSNGDPAIKLVHRLVLRQLPASKLLKLCPSTLHLNEALASIGEVIRHGARFVLTLEDLASSHYYFAIHGLKITLGFLCKNISFKMSVNYSHLDNLDQTVEISNTKGAVDEVTLKYLATSVFKRETMNEWRFLPELVSEVEQYLDVSSKIGS
ncbi:hypothetical protein TCAL_14310 [Tigriopus californicus]|uniref:Uncharacterized protein n=1 Tax=Tigriopus californicus TaxID=6832 RepID=A0A553NCX5_TIGCA|nr:hypothetical protein TCAL_14310 [Tigriopus californicus]